MEKLVLGNQVKLVMTGPDQVEQEIPCASHFWKNGYHYFLYEEKLEGYETAFRSRIKCRDGYLEIHRSGEAGMNMVFEENKSHRAQYQVPYGQIVMDISTHSVSMREEAFRLSVRAAYTMTVNGTELEQSVWSMKVANC